MDGGGKARCDATMVKGSMFGVRVAEIVNFCWIYSFTWRRWCRFVVCFSSANTGPPFVFLLAVVVGRNVASLILAQIHPNAKPNSLVVDPTSFVCSCLCVCFPGFFVTLSVRSRYLS